jgi:hypothetical protein
VVRAAREPGGVDFLDQISEGLGLELGAAQPTTTQSYTRVSSQKVRNDYFKGMEKILAATQGE